MDAHAAVAGDADLAVVGEGAGLGPAEPDARGIVAFDGDGAGGVIGDLAAMRAVGPDPKRFEPSAKGPSRSPSLSVSVGV